jgi:hypothetical protein
MTAEIEKLLQEVQSLSTDEIRRLRWAIDKQLADSERVISGNGSAQLQTLSRLRKELAALPVQNPTDGFSNRNHDSLLYGDDS